MVIACWSVKGGSGTTVVAASLALVLARRAPTTLLDLGGDASAVLGCVDPPGPGFFDWVQADDDVAPSALERLTRRVHPGLELLAPGRDGTVEKPDRATTGAAWLASRREVHPLVVDCGSALSPGDVGSAAVPAEIAAAADLSLLVLRPCFLALRRAVQYPMRPAAVVLVSENHRAINAHDVEDALGVPVKAEIAVLPAIARAVDAGLLARRLPRELERPLATGLAQAAA